MSTNASSPPDRPRTTQPVETNPVSAKSDGHPVRSRRWRRSVFGIAILAVLIAGVAFAIPTAKTALNTVSTDDAYVNGHVTFVAARVPGQVLRNGVRVDDNVR